MRWIFIQVDEDRTVGYSVLETSNDDNHILSHQGQVGR